MLSPSASEPRSNKEPRACRPGTPLRIHAPVGGTLKRPRLRVLFWPYPSRHPQRKPLRVPPIWRTHLASPISNLLAGLLSTRRGGFISLVQGPSSPPSERRSYHGTTPYLRPGRSPVRSPVAREIGPIRPIRPISCFLPPRPNTEHRTPFLFSSPTIWPESLSIGAFAREGHEPLVP